MTSDPAAVAVMPSMWISLGLTGLIILWGARRNAPLAGFVSTSHS